MRKYMVLTLFAAATALLSAQTAIELETVLNSPEITCSQASRFVLAAADILPGGGDAFALARERGWLPSRVGKGSSIRADSPISLGELSLLMMKSFGLEGGILYAIFPSPRYACRALVYEGIIQGRDDPGGRVDGRSFLQILGRMLAHVGEDGGEFSYE